jgi:NADPH:quinone reductase-like Zn-dependent oxidoreductase
VHIAAALGATVVATASPKNEAFVRSLGATYVVDHVLPDVSERVRDLVPGGVDAALPTVVPVEKAALAAVRDGGRITWINGVEGPGLERGITGAETNGSSGTELLEALTELVDTGGIHTVHVERIYSLADVPRALDDVAEGHVRGKYVIDLAQH